MDPNSQVEDKMGLAGSGKLRGRVAIITGGSRGIGRECALALARLGCNIVIAAKTVEPHPTLPGTIYTVAEEVRAVGAEALACRVDLRDDKSALQCVEETMKRFGRIDILINNASALWWQDIADTPVRKYDLITSINVRGTFCMTKFCLPHMVAGGFGRIVTMSPPLSNRIEAYAGRTAYNVSKFGMTMCALGVAAEFRDHNINANSLWPATVIESLASKNFKMGDRSVWRKANIIADATLGLCCEDGAYSGNMLIDDTYLRERWGFEDDDFVRYRCDPECEPPRLLAAAEEGAEGMWIKRGSVGKLEQDMSRSSELPSKL